LMEALPEGEHFVGTRGGGMDHAASLGSREGCASLIDFDPLGLRAIPVPEDWGFLVAHCLKPAEKSGPARQAFNARRAAGAAALARLGLDSFPRLATTGRTHRPPAGFLAAAYLRRAQRLSNTWPAKRAGVTPPSPHWNGRRLYLRPPALESHASLRDGLQVSCPELDRLVEAAMQSGALGRG